jgi:hypothetical protein
MLLKNYFCVIFLLIVVNVLHAQKFVNEFLNIGVGARAHGMSGAVIASNTDGTATFWNPAGLTKVGHGLQVNAMHAEWFAGVANYDYGSFVKQINKEKNTYGALTIIRMGVDNIPNTLNLIGPDGSVNYDDVTSFSAVSYAALFSYATNLINEKWSIGGSAKVINRSIGPFANAWGVGADFGVNFTGKNFSFGAMGKDITTTYNTWSFNFTEEEKEIFAKTGNDIPVSSTEVGLPRGIFGFAVHNDRFNEESVFQILVEADLIISTDGRAAGIGTQNFNLDPAIGLELGYKRLVYLRGGVGNVQRVLNEVNASRVTSVQPNIGLGLNLGRLGIDYALTNIGALGDENNALYSHIFSVRLDFDAQKKSQEPE